jgi:hypothetical protein
MIVLFKLYPELKCCADIKDLMNVNLLKLNQEKTELLLIGSKHQMQNMKNVISIKIGGHDIKPSSTACNIEAIFDCHMNMETHVNKIISSSWVHLRNSSKIRKYLTHKATTSIVHAFVSSKLDFNNSLLYGHSNKLINKLQRIQNTAARIVLCASRSTSAGNLLFQLHWLPIKQRLKFKLLLLTYKAIHGTTAPYLSDLI